MRKKYIIAAFAVMAFMLGGLHVLGTLHVLGMHQRMALYDVGRATLIYIRDIGCPPGSMDDLFNTSCLRRQDDAVGVGEFPLRAGLWDDVEKLKLCFPESVSELRGQGDCLIDAESGEEVLLIAPTGKGIWIVDTKSSTMWVWEQWNKLEHGWAVEKWLRKVDTRPVSLRAVQH